MYRYLLLFLFSTSLTTHATPLALERSTFFSVKGKITETSGAVYHSQSNTIWTVGDSGPHILGRTLLDDQTTDIVKLKGRQGDDCEELVLDESENLWVLCTGDNDRIKRQRYIHQVDLSTYQEGRPLQVKRKITLTYSHGPIDVEGAFIHGNTLYLFEKLFFKRSWIYKVDIGKNAASKQVGQRFKEVRGGSKLITGACKNNKGELFFLNYWGIYQLKDWEHDRPKSKLIYFDPFFGQTETLVCYEDQLLVARESGEFFLINN
jgi:hypothetical protein